MTDQNIMPNELFMCRNADGALFDYGFDSPIVKTTRYIRADLAPSDAEKQEALSDLEKLDSWEWHYKHRDLVRHVLSARDEEF